MGEVRQHDRNTPVDTAMEILEADGAVIVRKLVDDEVMVRVAGELEPYLQRACLIYLGSLFHGGGRNTTADTWRCGMITGYSPGWLRQEENQYLAVPPEVARHLPRNVQELIGYRLHGNFLGWVEGHDPHVVLEDRYDTVMAASPEGGEHVAETTVLKTATLGEPSRH